MFQIFIFSLFCIQIALAVQVKPWEPHPGTGQWLKKHESLLKETELYKNETKVVFIGASIVQFWQTEGKEFWNSYYVHKSALNYGIAGDTTSNVLWRIDNKEFDGMTPKVIVLQIGYNNMHSTTPPPTGPEIAHGVIEIIKQLRAKCPESKIINIGITPLNDPILEGKAKQINELLKSNENEKFVFFLDLTPNLVDSNGKQKKGLFRDGLHFTSAGYGVWHQTMKPLFETLYH